MSLANLSKLEEKRDFYGCPSFGVVEYSSETAFFEEGNDVENQWI